MKSKIFIAFILNFIFAVFEFIGGLLTNSVAIMSDSVHDIGDALAIGVSYLLERKSQKRPDENCTYGYTRYSVLGSVFTTLILIFGSCFVVYNAIKRIVSPEEINYNGMLIFAIIGVAVNLVAAIATRGDGSLNQKAVNLHMIEDVAGWCVVLIGSIVIKIANHFQWSNLYIIDPIVSIGIAIYILFNAYANLKISIDVFLEKTPSGVSVADIKSNLCLIDGVLNVHHVHIWSLDGNNNCATMHIVVDANHLEVKKKIKDKLKEFGIQHSTLELESKWECCDNKNCDINTEVKCTCCAHNH